MYKKNILPLRKSPPPPITFLMVRPLATEMPVGHDSGHALLGGQNKLSPRAVIPKLRPCTYRNTGKTNINMTNIFAHATMFDPSLSRALKDQQIFPTRIQTRTICQMMTMMVTYYSNLMAMTLDSMAYLKNNDGSARRYYLRSAVDQYLLFTYSIFSFGSPIFIL